MERIAARGFQFCVIDPEGDYAGLDGAVTVGTPDAAPSITEVIELLHNPTQNVVVDLTGLDVQDRPRLFAELIPRLCEFRARTARPHWLVIDEAHHMLPAVLGSAGVTLPCEFTGTILVTVQPDHVARLALELVQHALVIGEDAATTMRNFLDHVGREDAEIATDIEQHRLQRGEALFWQSGNSRIDQVSIIQPSALRLRHSRKYAQGALADDQSFYFRGAEGRLNLKANNLTLFLQMAEGVDDETWLHHLRAGDYSNWMSRVIKDEGLATEVAGIEDDAALDAAESRARVKNAVNRRYTAPA